MTLLFRYESDTELRTHDTTDAGMDYIRDLGRLWNDCLVTLKGRQHQIRSVKYYEDEPVFLLRRASLRSRIQEVVSVDHPKLNLLYPELGYFNMPTHCVYISRRVLRQWKLGMHPHNIQISIPLSDTLNRITMLPPEEVVGNAPLARSGYTALLYEIDIFNPVYMEYEEAIVSLTGEAMLSCALSRELALVIHPTNSEIHIMYHDSSVGAVDLKNNIVVLKPDFFWLQDTVRGVIPL